MAKPRKRVTKTVNEKVVATSTATSTTTSISEIKPVVPRQTPLKSLNEIQDANKDTKKVETTGDVFIQFGGKEISHEDILNRIRQAYKESGATDTITSLNAYVKPEESRIYYVINEDITGSIEY